MRIDGPSAPCEARVASINVMIRLAYGARAAASCAAFLRLHAWTAGPVRACRKSALARTNGYRHLQNHVLFSYRRFGGAFQGFR
jgi:hypothetical protein